MRARRPVHPDEAALLTLVDDDAAGSEDVSRHVSTCARCAKRFHELRETRALVGSLAGRKEQPRHDLAQRALGSLRRRNAAIGTMNEVFAALQAMLAGFAELLGGSRKPRG